MREITRDALLEQMPESIALVSCLSFEDRSLCVAEALSPKLNRWLVIVNEDIETDITAIRERAEAIATKADLRIEYLNAAKRNPLLLADAFMGLAGEQVREDGVHWVADITTMTHEMLLILVAAADEIMMPWRDLQLVYNVADVYSGDDTPEEKWISRGIHEIRSVIGYPGSWSPGEKTTLVALPGFDAERMRRMVEEIEPDQLVVGIACPVDDRHAWSAQKNRDIAERLLETREGKTFEYPALDPLKSINSILTALKDASGNILIAPLNSKVSTAALGILVRLKPEWQICYAPAFIYNLKYATPSNCFLTCSLGSLREHVVAQLAAQGNGG
ncbi:hypothetical protein ACERNI_13425 [Camelimonas sp. ID_303_24]